VTINNVQDVLGLWNTGQF